MCRKTVYIVVGIFMLTLLRMEVAVGEVYSIMPSIGLEERYDSNVRLNNEDENVDEDYVTSVIPQIGIIRSNGRIEFSGLYRLVDRHYSDDSDLNYVSHMASLSLAGSLTPRTKFSISDSFASTKDPIETTESREVEGIVVRRTGIISNRASVALSREISPLFSLGIKYSDFIYEFDDRNLIDSRTDMVSLESRWTQTRNRVISATYGYTYFTYDNEDSNNVDEHSLLLGIEQRVSETLSLNLSAGAAYIRDIEDEFISTGYGSFIRSSNGSTAKISYSRSATTSFGLTNEININDTVSIRLDQSIGRSFKFSLSGSYAQNKTEPTESLDVKSFNAGVNGEWLPVRWLKIGIGYLHYNQWGESLSDGDVERDQVFVSLTAAPEWRF